MPNENTRLWLAASAVAFLCCLVAAGLLIGFADRITQYGFAQSIYFLVLTVAGLLAAGFLFGALRSYGRYKGRVFSGTLELGGPVVVAILIIVIGLFYASPTPTFDLVVRPHGPLGNSDVLRSGTVTVFFGSNATTAPVRDNGQAQFNEVPASFMGAHVDITVDIPDYRLAEAGPFRIPKNKIINLAVVHEQPSAELAGTLLYESGKPVAGAHLTVNHGLAEGYTDERGYFSIRVPLKLGSIVQLAADHAGTSGYDNSVTVSQNLTLTFIAKRH